MFVAAKFGLFNQVLWPLIWCAHDWRSGRDAGVGALLPRSGTSLRKEEKIKQNQEGLDELKVTPPKTNMEPENDGC